MSASYLSVITREGLPLASTTGSAVAVTVIGLPFSSGIGDRPVLPFGRTCSALVGTGPSVEIVAGASGFSWSWNACV